MLSELRERPLRYYTRQGVVSVSALVMIFGCSFFAD